MHGNFNHAKCQTTGTQTFTINLLTSIKTLAGLSERFEINS